ncbi:MAG: hypothetical protein J5982_06270 [Bacilli bacterium]|nr:hypothetical protein [Bacilli bacterium]
MNSRLSINSLFIIFAILFSVILTISIYSLNIESKYMSKVNDINETIDINSSKLNVRYIKGNMIDEKIQYGNIVSKVIEIKNKGDIDLTYAINLNESEISNRYLTFRIYESSSFDENSFVALSKEEFLSDSINLGYNFYVSAKSTKYIRIVFKSNYEDGLTDIKGILKVTSNLSEKDVFISNVNLILSNLIMKIKELNGINVSGIYIINVDELELPNYNGYILINAEDISDLKFYLSIYNDKYMVINLLEKNLKSSNIQPISNDIIVKLNEEYVCKSYSKKSCLNFSSLEYNPKGGRENFYNEVQEVIKKVQNNFSGDRHVYVYSVREDIENNTNLEGFILIDNQSGNPEYYLYVHNYLFMISGYNYSKLGNFKSNSNTIRAYNNTAFNLTNSKSKVCEFSNFSNCVDRYGNPIIE